LARLGNELGSRQLFNGIEKGGCKETGLKRCAVIADFGSKRATSAELFLNDCNRTADGRPLQFPKAAAGRTVSSYRGDDTQASATPRRPTQSRAIYDRKRIADITGEPISRDRCNHVP
jgi:hypothetical protein